jgi:hypothetical protein
MKYLNQHFIPSDCDIHFAALQNVNQIPDDLSIRSVRALLSEYGSVSEKYADVWRNKALSVRIQGALGLPQTISQVTKQVRLV